jgi:hypothetical protein
VSRRAATALPLILIAASAAAFLRTEQLKLRHSPVANPHVRQSISPGCTQTGCHRVAHIRFTLRDAQTLTMAMALPNGTPVKQLVSHRRYRKGPVRVAWDGSTNAGSWARDGRYDLQVTLSNGRRITIPEAVVVDTVPPTITLGKIVRKPAYITIPYERSPGIGHAEMVVTTHSGRVVLQKHVIPHVCYLQASEVPPGRYTVTLIAVDRAGNRTTHPPSFTVTFK